MRPAAVFVAFVAVGAGTAAPVPTATPTRMTAEEFVGKLRADPGAADAFDGKPVELTGTTPPDWLARHTADLGLAVTAGPVPPDGRPPISRPVGHVAKLDGAELPCEVADDQRAAAHELGPNQKVRVTGTFARGKAGRPDRLTAARFEVIGPPTARAVTAAELAGEYAKFAEFGGAPHMKRFRVFGVVVGEVAEVLPGDSADQKVIAF